MSATTLNHYETLGVAPDATDADIKRAWARKVREHPPEKDAEANQRINEAKQVLLDPKARARYDAHLNHGSEIAALMLEAMIASNAEDHAAAAAAFRKAVALAPDDDNLRHLWALETKRAGDVAGAVRILRGLVRRAPDVALYLFNLGTMLWEIEGTDRQASLSESLELLKQAVALEPHNSDYHVGLARCYRHMSLYDQAEQAIEAAVMTDGEVNVQDIEALFELPIIHIFAQRLERIAQDADRIRAVVADLDEDAHQICGYRFAKLAAELVEIHAYEPALHCARAAVKCAPTDANLRKLESEVADLSTMEDELAALARDGSIPSAIKVLVAVRGLVRIDQMEPKDAQQRNEEAIEALSSIPAAVIVQALDRARSKYPTLYKLGSESFSEIRRVAERLSSGQASPASTGASGTGCCLILAVPALFVLWILSVIS